MLVDARCRTKPLRPIWSEMRSKVCGHYFLKPFLLLKYSLPNRDIAQTQEARSSIPHTSTIFKAVRDSARSFFSLLLKYCCIQLLLCPILSSYFPPLCFLCILAGALQVGGDTLRIFMVPQDRHCSVVIGPTMTLMLRKRSVVYGSRKWCNALAEDGRSSP